MPHIEIRADFRRRAFALFVNNEPIGFVFRQYKFALLARDWLKSEYEHA